MANTGQYDSQTNIETEDYEREIFVRPEAAVIYGGSAVNSVNGQVGDVVLTTSDLENTSDYQTGAQVQNAIAGKQDKLTAGSNIQINNDVISATDTTYSAGNGLDLTGTEFSVDSTVVALQSDLPTVNDATLTIQKNSTDVGTFTANASSNSTINITVPTATSQLVNDSGYTTNTGTITSVKMNGSTVATSGEANLGTVITDVSEKQDIADNSLATSNKTVPGAINEVNSIAKGKANKISVVQTSASTIEINSNTFYKFGEVASLNITLASITDNTIYNEYMFEFVSGTTATTLTLPSSIKWLKTPTIDANKIYQCSIVDSVGLLVGVANV